LQLKIPNSTFFRAELVANYELLPISEKRFKDIRNPAASLLKSMQAIEWPFLRVTVPAKAFAIVPHLSIVAHEIGHALFSKMAWNLSSFNRNELPQLLQRIATRLNAAKVSNETFQILNEIFVNWMEEFSADAFAYFLTGPAFFFALPEFCQFLSAGYGMSETHPANELRRSVMFTKLSAGGSRSYAHAFKQHTEFDLTEDFNSPLILKTPPADQMFAELVSSAKSREQAAVMTELHQSITTIIPVIYQNVEQYLSANAPDTMYSADRYGADLTEHLVAMLAAVPPIEAGQMLTKKAPAEFATILNVGWAVLLTKLGDLRVRPSRPEHFGSARLERLQGLLAKAVELSEARRRWQNRKN